MEVRRGVSVLEQVNHPGTEIGDPLHQAIQWRLLFPLIGHVLSLPPVLFFGLADLGCVAVLGYVVTLLRGGGWSWLNCSLVATTLGAASWFYTSTGWLGYFDAWLALALIVTAFGTSRWSLWAAALWAPWVDERFAIALPLALVCRWLTLSSPAKSSAGIFDWRKDALVPATFVATFLVIRLAVLPSGSGASAAGYFGGHNFLNASAARILLGIWEGLRVGWLFVVAGLILLRPRPLPCTALACIVVITIAIGLATAQDYSRSMTMIIPAAVLGAFLIHERLPARNQSLFTFGACAALLLPAHHVMNDRVNPIYYLYHELAALETPPPGAMPELYELHAIHEMERGEFANAERDLTLAIKLTENPSSPARQRGILYASQGRWADALKDFSTEVENDSENPDAWFMRAQANLALGNVSRARSDIDRALSLGNETWAKRPDVTRFLTKLNRAGGATDLSR